jgi:hypothetical protein
MQPKFIVDLPGGGGKRPASTFTEYDRTTGESRFKAPGLGVDKADKEYSYWDPVEPNTSAPAAPPATPVVLNPDFKHFMDRPPAFVSSSMAYVGIRGG